MSATDTTATLATETARDIFERMVRIRRFEEAVAQLQAAGELPGAVHLYIGQEAVAAGFCAALEPDDYLASNHRGHGHIVAKGGDVGRCLAEILGRSDGYCGGKGGSMHLADMGLHIIGANGIVGAGMPIATGAALASSIRGSNEVSVCFFGDGAANQGTFHESLNLAAIWKLPVVYVCENNGFGELTRTERVVAGDSIAARAAGYGIPGVRIDGNDAAAVHQAATEALARARAGDGPTLVEAMTFRIHDHSEGLEAIAGATRTDEELAGWRERDPIVLLRAQMLAGGADEAELDATDAEITAEVAAGLAFARASPPPDPATAATEMWAPAPALEEI
jgi:pyruvate dehydrogenase E1 component alpha subunit